VTCFLFLVTDAYKLRRRVHVASCLTPCKVVPSVHLAFQVGLRKFSYLLERTNLPSRPHYPLVDLFDPLLPSLFFQVFLDQEKWIKLSQNGYGGGRRHFEGKKSRFSRSSTHGTTRRRAKTLRERKQRVNSVCILK